LENTHPFLSCDEDLALVHNGNWDNEMARLLLMRLGHRIYGDTDSEVITHLICELKEDYGIEGALSLISEDRFGVVLILTKDGAIWGCKSSYFGDCCIVKSGDVVVVASEASAIGEACAGVFDEEERVILWELESGSVFCVADSYVHFLDKKPKGERLRFEELRMRTKVVYYGRGWYGRRGTKRVTPNLMRVSKEFFMANCAECDWLRGVQLERTTQLLVKCLKSACPYDDSSWSYWEYF